MKVDIEKLSAPELVAFAESKGLVREIRGMTEGQVKELLRQFLAETEDNIISQPQETDSLESLSWPDIKKLAKEKGIKTFKKKRSEIETLLRETEEASYPKTITDETIEKALVKEQLVKRVSLEDKLIALEKRIDRIVAALNHSKSVQGL